MFTIIGLSLAYLAIGSVFGRINRRVWDRWMGDRRNRGPAEYLLFPYTALRLKDPEKPMFANIDDERVSVALVALTWPLKLLWCAGVFACFAITQGGSQAAIGVWNAFTALIWNFSETMLNISEVARKIPGRLMHAVTYPKRLMHARKLAKLGRTKRLIEEYAKAAGIESDLATAEQIADVEHRLLAIRAAESDLVELKRKLEDQSEASSIAGHLTSLP